VCVGGLCVCVCASMGEIERSRIRVRSVTFIHTDTLLFLSPYVLCQNVQRLNVTSRASFSSSCSPFYVSMPALTSLLLRRRSRGCTAATRTATFSSMSSRPMVSWAPCPLRASALSLRTLSRRTRSSSLEVSLVQKYTQSRGAST
jgi:hypothetical protein